MVEYDSSVLDKQSISGNIMFDFVSVEARLVIQNVITSIAA